LGDSVSILLGRGDGTFRAAQDFGVGEGPISVTGSDFNGDGHLDLATVDRGDNSVSILLGQGDGTFNLAQVFAVEEGPISITAGDFNGDGHLDLANANETSRTMGAVSVVPAEAMVPSVPRNLV
jgi:hypothetical protein